MTNQEIKQKIETIEKSIASLKKMGNQEANIERLEEGITKYKSMLEAETSLENKQKKEVHKKQIKIKAKPKQPEKKPKTMLEKALEQPETFEEPKSKRQIIIKKDKKQETHDTSFGKDIKDAILVLNKERYKIKEIRDYKTGKVQPVKHSIEYKNAKTIQRQVNKIFDAAVYDIARTTKQREVKKDVIETVNNIRDLHCLWINELDILIANEEKKDLEKIEKMFIGLIKEARKNDEDNKWRNAAGLAEIAKKFGI
jgi:hypothetical protein